MKLRTLLTVALTLTATSFTSAANEQVWEATHTNNQQICGIDYANGQATGQILTKGETSTDNGKAIDFNLKTNTSQVGWKITEAKLVENAGRFDFDDNLLNVGDRNKTSVIVNNTEYEWTSVNQNRAVDGKAKLRLAPKINLDATEFPIGTTKIQGKIVVTCSN